MHSRYLLLVLVTSVIGLSFETVNGQEVTLKQVQELQIKQEELESQLFSAVLTTITSVGVAAFTGAFSYITYRRTKKIEKEVDYEYEARQRIYNDCLPDLFKFRRAVDAWPAKFSDIMNHSSKGNLLEDKNHKPIRLGVKNPDDYFKLNCIYRLLAPLAAFKIFEERLTGVDLRLDRYLTMHYDFGNDLYRMLTKDNTISEKTGISYERNESNRQGLRGYEVDKLSNFLIVTTPEQAESKTYLRLKTFIEFELDYKKHILPNVGKKYDVETIYPIQEFLTLDRILTDFDPKNGQKPILERVLFCYTVLCYAIDAINDELSPGIQKDSKSVSQNDLKTSLIKKSLANQSHEDFTPYLNLILDMYSK